MIFLVATISYAGLRNLDLKLAPSWLPITDAQIGKNDLYARGIHGYPLYGDYASASMQVRPAELARPRPADRRVLPPLAAVPTVRVITDGGACLNLQIEN